MGCCEGERSDDGVMDSWDYGLIVFAFYNCWSCLSPGWIQITSVLRFVCVVN